MTLELQDLLLERPVTLILWDLDTKADAILPSLQQETEIRIISSLEEFWEWLKMVEVQNLIVAVKERDKLQAVKQSLDKLPVDKRRKLFVIFIAPDLNTFDMKDTFLFSANLILNEKDLKEFEKIYSKAKAYWEHLYKPYFTTLNKLIEGAL
jgi:hypothetical protein